jgi:cell division protease FtsH
VNTRKGLLAALLVLIGVGLAVAVSLPLLDAWKAPHATERDSNYSELRDLVAKGVVTQLTIFGGNSGAAVTKDGTHYRALLPAPIAADLGKDAAGRGAEVNFAPEEFLPYNTSLTLTTLLAIVGNVLIFSVLGFMLYKFVGKGAGNFRTEQATPVDGGVRFDEVAGCESEKAELMEVVEFLKDPGRFHRLGGRVPTGVLLSGPPGTGKTLLARAVAGEAGVPFFHLAGSDFVEMFVGVGAARVRSAFAKARKKAPCILFIDEIDAVGRARSNASHGGHEERDQTLNQLLVEMDGFKPNSGVIVIAATNRPDILDKALTRPGRFSRQVVLPPPDLAGRRHILGVHAGKLVLEHDIDLSVVARGTPGFTGAELANLVNEAAIIAARRLRPAVTMADFDAAKDRLLLGNERPPMAMSEEDRRLTAIHEAGHAVVALHCPASDPIHKATILPRGQALGMVVRLPERDQPSLRRSRLEADLAVAMGGRAAEMQVFGSAEVSTGASGDLRMATGLARRMVTEWGMGADNGLLWHGALDPTAPFSEEMARQIDAEVRALLDAAMTHAQAILSANPGQLRAVADGLLENEVLTGEEIEEIALAATRQEDEFEAA